MTSKEAFDTINREIEKYYCKLIFADGKIQLVNFVPPKTVKVIHIYAEFPKLSIVRQHIIAFEKDGLLETP